VIGNPAVIRQVAEVREALLEMNIDGTDGAVTLLGDNDLGLVLGGLQPRHESVVLGVELFLGLAGVALRIRLVQVILLAIDEQHNIGVLLDRPGLTQVRQVRALVLALFDGP